MNMNNTTNNQRPTYSATTIDFTSPIVLKEFSFRGRTGVTVTQIITGTTISVMSVLDNKVNKTVEANTIGYPSRILLWSGATYDSIGQWTDQDVINRIREIYTK